MNEVKCSMCGKCCVYVNPDDPEEVITCKYLKRISPEKTYCSIYNRRIMHVIGQRADGEKLYCKPRIMMKKHFDGCPYNELIKL